MLLARVGGAPLRGAHRGALTRRMSAIVDPVGTTPNATQLSALLDGYFAGVRRAATAVRPYWPSKDVPAEAAAAKDALVGLFACGAVIRADGADIAQGHAGIASFYTNGVLHEELFWPRPVEGSRSFTANAVVVDIFLHSKHRSRLVRDTFTFDDDRKICHMNVETISDHHSAASA
mmetsp:Transcript_8126/g.25083  ORF Transcript_8126/g.25083 Transcript_8126/m.25083 type:complete len:176 (-) Transcript_8126:1235-1762(-)